MRFARLVKTLLVFTFTWGFFMLAFYLFTNDARHAKPAQNEINPQQIGIIAPAFDQQLKPAIKLTNIWDFYLDTSRSAVLFLSEQTIFISFLIVTRKFEYFWGNNEQLILKKDGNIFSTHRMTINRIVAKNKYYRYGWIKQNLTESSRLRITAQDRITFQFEINGNVSQEFQVNLIEPSKDASTLTARLIKCMWLPKDVKTFEYILELIIGSHYDSIHVCVFGQEEELRRLFQKYESRIEIKIIQLQNIPDGIPGKPDLTNYNDVLASEMVIDKGEVLDPILEMTLNLIYPFLINKFRYIHAADFDHLIFTNNQTFYQRIQDIVRKNVKPEKQQLHASLYFDQYWALDNKKSWAIFKNVNDFLESHGIDAKTLAEPPQAPIRYPVRILVEDLVKFGLEIQNRAELVHAVKIFQHLNNTSGDDLFRQVILKFWHNGIYGQMVHNTKTSMLIKLCSVGEIFKDGVKISLATPHTIHYRDYYNFALIRDSSNLIQVESFVLWQDFVQTEL